MFGGTLTVAVIATIAAYFGPAGAWLVAGIGLAAALLVHAAHDRLAAARLKVPPCPPTRPTHSTH